MELHRRRQGLIADRRSCDNGPAFRHLASAGSLAVGSWLRRGPGPTPVAQGIQLKEPPEETSSADILGANIAQLEALFSTDGLGITPGNPTAWAQGVVVRRVRRSMTFSRRSRMSDFEATYDQRPQAAGKAA